MFLLTFALLKSFESKTAALAGAHLDKGDLAGACRAFEVADGDLSIVLEVTLLAQHVVDASNHFVPLIMVPKSDPIVKR